MLRRAQIVANAWPSVPLAPLMRIGATSSAGREGAKAGQRRDGGARHDRLGDEAVGAAPPALALEHRVARLPAGGELGDQRGERGRARLRRAHVERSGLVVAPAFAEQAVPVERAEQRPRRDGADVGAGRARAQRRAPDLEQPAQLVFAAGVDVRLGHRHRDAVALPGFLEQRGDRRRRHGEDANRLDVDEFGVRRAAARSVG